MSALGSLTGGVRFPVLDEMPDRRCSPTASPSTVDRRFVLSRGAKKIFARSSLLFALWPAYFAEGQPPDRLNLFSGSGGADREPFEKDGPALLIRAGLSLASKEETAPATWFQLWARSAPNGITVRWGPKAAAAIEIWESLRITSAMRPIGASMSLRREQPGTASACADPRVLRSS